MKPIKSFYDQRNKKPRITGINPQPEIVNFGEDTFRYSTINKSSLNSPIVSKIPSSPRIKEKPKEL